MAPQSLFEETELPPADVVDGCLRSVVSSHERLESVLELAPPGTVKGIQLERAMISAERILAKLRDARREQLHAAWRR